MRGRLYVFSIGAKDHEHHMNVFDQMQWTGWHSVPGGGTTLVSDAATVYNGKLYLFAIGISDHGHYVNTFDAKHWSGWSLLPGLQSVLADAAVVYAQSGHLLCGRSRTRRTETDKRPCRSLLSSN